MVKVILNGERVILRPFKEKHDKPLFKKWLSDPEVTDGFAMEEEDIKKSIEDLEAKKIRWPKEIIFFTIEAKKSDDNITIGSCKICAIKPKNRSAEITIIIGEKEYRSKGYGAEAVKLLIDYGFNQLNLNRIGSSVFERNHRSLKMTKKIGFKKEGRTRKDTFYKDRFWDTVNFGLLKEEWEKLSKG